MPKNQLFLRAGLTPFMSKIFQIGDDFFSLLFPKDSKSLKTLGIQLWEVGTKRHLNGTSKVNRHTDTQTDTHVDKSTYRKHRPRRKASAQRADALKRKELLENLLYAQPLFLSDHRDLFAILAKTMFYALFSHIWPIFCV